MGSPQFLECYCATVRQTARAVTQAYNQALRPAAIEITHFTLLSRLDERPGLTTGELASLLVMDQTTVTRTLQLMERAGLVGWQHGLDRRIKCWSATASGAAKLAAARPLWQAAQASLALRFGVQASGQLHQLGFALTKCLMG